MTRVLSELLGAREPSFQLGLQQLEAQAGHPQADIRLSSEIQQAVRDKVHQLGLDKHDTTGQELYAALGERLKGDERRFIAALQGSSDVAVEPLAQLALILKKQVSQQSSYALKSTTAKKLLRMNLPKKTMKLLGYRSFDSMLKHETAASLFAAAWLIESQLWAKKMVSSYAKLRATDFEQRSITIEQPHSKRWLALAETVVAVRKHSVLSFKELGSVVMLPLPAQRPQLATLTTAVLALHAINEIRAAGTFLKLHQVQPNFGAIVQQVVVGEPVLPSQTLDEPVAWNSLHQYFTRFQDSVRADLFEPVIAAEELVWTSIEHVLSSIEPTLEFWEHTAHLALLKESQPISCNLTDLLLSHGNGLAYDNRLVHYFRQALRSEILLRYLSHDKLEQTVFSNLQAQLAPELVTN